ncbi:MAG: class I SAM-dependent methyltransferase [Proteobacteria bacterium]|nr:class I SAM-dependent methyltransferase [Pseudomonadota bacterium]
MVAVKNADPFGVLEDERIAAVLRRLHREARWLAVSARTNRLRHLSAALANHPAPFMAEDATPEKHIAIDERQAAFGYLTARTLRARTIVELGSSLGILAIWLAAALRANGGGCMVTTESVAERARVAQRNFEEAGLADIIEVRVGETPAILATGPEKIDLVLNSGPPKHALDIVKLLAPRLRPGAVVLTDAVGCSGTHYRSYIGWIRDQANGFQSTLLPLKGGLEYSVRR